MFGYVTPNKPEMKMREFTRYKGFYCGLCDELHENYGVLGQLTLTYDMTFLIILLTSLYEKRTVECAKRCVFHPQKKTYRATNEITGYAADMNVLLAIGHMEDDWHDEKKLVAFAASKMFLKHKKAIEKKYKRQSKIIKKSLHQLSVLEKKNEKNLDKVSRPFGEMLGEIFVYKEDPFRPILKKLGFYLGKYIYILDAYEDVTNDVKKGCYNPFSDIYNDIDFKKNVREILDTTLKLAIVEFEKLPLEQDLAILRNILYEGVLPKKNKDKKNSICKQ